MFPELDFRFDDNDPSTRAAPLSEVVCRQYSAAKDGSGLGMFPRGPWSYDQFTVNDLPNHVIGYAAKILIGCFFLRRFGHDANPFVAI